MENPESLAQGAVERLSEDESLRGDLTDAGFGPLLEWAANAAIAFAGQISGNNPEAEMDNYASRLKTLVQTVVEDAGAGKIEDPTPLLDFVTSDRNRVKDQLESLKLSPDPDENAKKIAEVLNSGLKAGNSPEDKPSSSPTPPENKFSPAPVSPADKSSVPPEGNPSSPPASPDTGPQNPASEESVTPESSKTSLETSSPPDLNTPKTSDPLSKKLGQKQINSGKAKSAGRRARRSRNNKKRKK